MMAIQLFNEKGRGGYERWRSALPLAAKSKTPSADSVARWITRRNVGNSLAADPRRHAEGGGTGRPTETKIEGAELVLLALFKLANPEATLDQCRVFLQRARGAAQQHTRQVVSVAITKSLTMKRKKLQHVPLQQDPVRNAQWFAQPPPIGCNGVATAELIDVDEAGFALSTCQPTYGHAVAGRVPFIRTNKNVGSKLTMICAIDAAGNRWLRVREMAGTGVEDFYEFLDQNLLPFLPAAAGRRTLMWDNLSSHVNPRVLHRVRQAANVHHLERPTYNPAVAPIEYFFAEVKRLLRAHPAGTLTQANFRARVLEAAQRVPRAAIANTFTHCGY
eukprot:g889.t1